MGKYYTELNIETLKKSFDEKKANSVRNSNGVNKSSNTILLIIATLTAAVLAVMLMILIQKKISSNNLNDNQAGNNIIISPTIIQSPTKTPVISEPMQQLTSSPSGIIFPTQKVIISPTEKIASPTGEIIK